MKNKNILVPIDFSEESVHGLRTAADIALTTHSKLNLLHVIDDSSPSEFREDADMQAKNRDKKEHEHFMAELIQKRKAQMNEMKKDLNEEIDSEVFLEFGSFSEGLEKFLSENSMDLVVVGTTGETTISEKFTGNHAAKAFRVAEIPVFSVKNYEAASGLKNMLLLVDIKGYDEEVVRRLLTFAELLEMNILVGHIKKAKDVIEDDILSRLDQFVRNHDIDNTSIHIIGQGQQKESLKEFVEKHDIDVIASISEGDSGLIRLIFGSETEKFINKTDEPVLAISE
jgi:nucleotide-binding universal stress UspA family protein